MITQKTFTDIYRVSNKLTRMTLELESMLAKDIVEFNETNKQANLNDIRARVRAITSSYDFTEIEEVGDSEIQTLTDRQVSLFNKSDKQQIAPIVKDVTILATYKALIDTQNERVVDIYIRQYTTFTSAILSETEVILKEIKTNPTKFFPNLSYEQMNNIDFLQERARQLGFENVQSRFVTQDNTIYYLQNSGRHEDPHSWNERNLRQSFIDQADENILSVGRAYNNDLVRTSAHGDCSDLCIKYQGRIYSRSGNDARYTRYSDILLSSGRGGTFRHWNCGHYVSNYIEGLSDPDLFDDMPDNETINENYNNRQAFKKYKADVRKITKSINKAKEVGASKETISKLQERRRALLNKAKYYENKMI